MENASKKHLGIVAPHYRGCLRDFNFDFIKLLEGLPPGRPKRPPSKSSTPYGVYGKIPFTCQVEDYRPVTFQSPESYVKVTLPKLPQDNDTFSTSFKFRTFYDNGLLFSRSAIKVKMYVRLYKGSLLYDVTANGTRANIKLGKNLHDGEWHDINATIIPPKVSVTLDGNVRSRILNMTSLLLDYSNKSRMKIFAGRGGSASRYSGFVGCMLNLNVDSHRIPLKAMDKKKHSRGVEVSRCSTKNRCSPNPCQNQGLCMQDWKEFYCDCQNTYFEGKTCQNSVYKQTCEDYKRLGLKKDSHCLLHTGRSNAKDRFTALCNVTNNKRAYTVIKHNLGTTSVRVKDGEFIQDQFIHKIYYQNLEEDQIAALIRHSAKCRQFVGFDCMNAKLLNSPNGPSHAFWTSLDRKVKFNHWGGANESRKCACGMSTPSKCANPAKFCNCDLRDNLRWRTDEGYLDNKDHLPVMMIMFNKRTGKTDSSFRLGPLECWGKRDKTPVKTTVKDLIEDACFPVVEPSTPPPTVTTVTMTTTVTTSPCPAGEICFNLTFPTDPTGPIKWTNPSTNPPTTTKEYKDFNVQEKESREDPGLGTTGIVLISCALVILLLLALKFALPKIISCVRTHSKRGEYIVPNSGPPGYPARLMPLVTKRSSRGRQLTHGENTHLPTEHNNGNIGGLGTNSYWV